MASRPGPRLLFVSALCALLFAAGLARNGPPSPAPANAPPELFSASRARSLLRSVLEPETAHPQGSAENALVESRIVAALAGMGYSPSIQEEFVCGSYGTCGTVRNILARRQGREQHGAVLLAAHFDSVEAGPGASDDGLGVASALEIARILGSAPPRARPVVFLLDDGEEQGLLGAEAFAALHPWARDISAVVNLEARGTSGASLLFETSRDNRWLIEAARAIPHPVSSSVFPAIYRMLPNDTDLTVFRRQGMAGVNFACIGGVSHYHTPRDDLAHASLATLQHQGENALAMVESLESLSAESARPGPKGDAVFFDVFGLTIVGWPEAWTLPIAATATLVLALGLALLFRKRALLVSEWLAALALFLGMIALPAIAAFAAGSLLKSAGILPSSWTAHPVAPLAGLWLLALAAAWTIALPAARRIRPVGLSAGIWTGWALLGAAAAAALPGMSFLFLVPLVAAVAIPSALDPEKGGALAAPPVAAFLWLPMAWRLWEALGFGGIAVIAAAVALPATTLVPFAARLDAPSRKILLLGLAAGSAALLLASIGLAPYTADSPERLTIFWHQNADSGRAEWILDGAPVPLALSTAGKFSRIPGSPFPWSALRALEAAAPHEVVAGPEFRLEERTEANGRVRFRGRIVSPRGARFARISFPPAARVERLSIGGVLVPSLSARALFRSNGWSSYSCVTLPAAGLEIEGEVSAGSPTFILLDRTAGIPASGSEILAARPPTAVPSQTGDASLVTRRIRL